MQSVNEIQPAYIILQKKKKFKKYLQKLRAENQFQALLCLQRIKHNLYCKMNSLKETKICPNQHAYLLGFPLTEDSLKIRNGLELVSRSHFSHNFLMTFFFCNITQAGQISLPGCVYFPNYSVKCNLCFMLGYLMTS